ncbi:MAG: TVP38/TMEM64 family protein [Mariprofundaceae bacterium]|nr:TVP38/TMEM64 family protein [Mariprofundaceae bacterium]
MLLIFTKHLALVNACPLHPTRPKEVTMFKRVLPIIIILSAIAAFFFFDLGHYLSFDALAEHRQTLTAQVEAHAVLASLIYMMIYIAVVALSLPGGLMMTLTGGFLFGAVWGAILAVTGATLGATILFLIAKTSLGDFLLAKAGDSIKKLQAGFEEDVWSYMFILRVVPIFPFFLVNLAPAFLGVPLRVYIVATFFGIIPGTFVYALAGSGLGQVFDQGATFSAANIMTPSMMGALVGLGVLALVPVVYKKWQQKEGKA